MPQWDDKITTLPGLYLLSVGVLGYLSGLQQPTCTLYLLRMVNLLFSVGTLITLYSILKVLNAGQVSPLTSGRLDCLLAYRRITVPKHHAVHPPSVRGRLPPPASGGRVVR